MKPKIFLSQQVGTLKNDLHNLTAKTLFLLAIPLFFLSHIDSRERKIRGHERGHYEAIERRRSYASNVRAEASEERKKKRATMRKCIVAIARRRQRRRVRATAGRLSPRRGPRSSAIRKFIREKPQPLSIISACPLSSVDIRCPHRFILYLVRCPRVGLITLKRRVRKSIRP